MNRDHRCQGQPLVSCRNITIQYIFEPPSGLDARSFRLATNLIFQPRYFQSVPFFLPLRLRLFIFQLSSVLQPAFVLIPSSINLRNFFLSHDCFTNSLYTPKITSRPPIVTQPRPTWCPVSKSGKWSPISRLSAATPSVWRQVQTSNAWKLCVGLTLVIIYLNIQRLTSTRVLHSTSKRDLQWTFLDTARTSKKPPAHHICLM